MIARLADARKRSERVDPTNNFRRLVDRFADSGTAAETAYAVLRQAILNNILVPGTRLRADELAKELGVSKTPVREALRKLEAEDLITAGAGNSLAVKVLSENELLEIYYTREALEGMAARLAAENAGQLDLVKLRAVLHDIEDAFGRSNLDHVRNFGREFQLLVFEAAHNDVLLQLLTTLREKVRNHRVTTMSLPGRARETVEFCRELFAGIEKRDPDSAERIARANRRRALELRLKMMRTMSPSR
jgi:DNA-binding GntR family transcriptional regulator